MTPPQSYGLSGNWNDYSTYTEEEWGIEKKFDASRSLKKATDCETYFGSNLATNIKNDPYSRIRSCNECEGVDRYGQDLSEAAIKKAKGQAYFFRAMQLFDWYVYTGVFPVENKVLMAADR